MLKLNVNSITEKMFSVKFVKVIDDQKLQDTLSVNISPQNILQIWHTKTI